MVEIMVVEMEYVLAVDLADSWVANLVALQAESQAVESVKIWVKQTEKKWVPQMADMMADVMVDELVASMGKLLDENWVVQKVVAMVVWLG